MQSELPSRPLNPARKQAQHFVGAASDYSEQGVACFNTCVHKFETNFALGYEKRCMQGCLQVGFQLFTVNATQTQ